MTWIKTIPAAAADEKLRRALEAQRELYPIESGGPMRQAADGETPDIVAAYSLIPDALYNSFATLAALTAPDLPLSGRQQEMIATVVMSANHNPDGVESHLGFLRRGALDEELVGALRADYKTAPLSKQDKVMLDYAVQLTRDATRISPQDHERLRAAGFDDRGILQITLVASWVDYLSRVADALGVGRSQVFKP
ncbi:MAG TPA: peroxidase-related enzyme [Pyrinomonadaceae bacterium]